MEHWWNSFPSLCGKDFSFYDKSIIPLWKKPNNNNKNNLKAQLLHQTLNVEITHLFDYVQVTFVNVKNKQKKHTYKKGSRLLKSNTAYILKMKRFTLTKRDILMGLDKQLILLVFTSVMFAHTAGCSKIIKEVITA